MTDKNKTDGADPVAPLPAVDMATTTQTKGRLAHPLAQQILECDDHQQELHTVAPWNDLKVMLKSISSSEASAFATDFKGLPDGSLEPLIFLVIRGVCDPKTGERIFSDDMTTRHMLAAKLPGALNDIARRVLKLSGLGITVRETSAAAEKN